MPLKRRIQQWCALHRNLFGVVPVIIHQMAKVGSTAVFAAVSDSGLPVWQVHRMDAVHLKRMRAQRRAYGWADMPVPPHDLLGLRIRRKLLDRGGRAQLITLVRDPIARNLSSYFEHLDTIWHTTDAHVQVPMEGLIRGFHERFPHDEPLTWFDDEMLAATGIDVYASPFPAMGHVTLRRGKLDLIILKNELSDSIKTAALRDFLGQREMHLRSANRTADKAKGAVYRRFVETIRFDPAFVDRMLDSRYTRHFYSPQEIEAMRQRYTP